MGFTMNNNMVRVDFFRKSGKWYSAVSLNWDTYESKEGELIYDIFRRCLKEQYPNSFIDMWAVCLKPYHIHSHPLMITHKGKENVSQNYCEVCGATGSCHLSSCPIG